jgi:dihydroflavonol-4-reductase
MVHYPGVLAFLCSADLVQLGPFSGLAHWAIMTKVLVTGATGFIGGALVRALVERGDAVRVLVRPGSDLGRLAGLDVETVIGDVTRPETLPPAVEGVRVVYHLAGMLGRYGVPESAYHALHVEGTCNVVRACAGRPVERLVQCSSPGMLGAVAPGEPPRDERSAHHPVSAYERSKSAAERAALPLAAELGVPLVIARPEFVYGPGDRHVVGLYRAIQRGTFFYIGAGDCLCHPSYIDDVVAGLIACASERTCPLEAYHICGPRPVTIRELVRAIARALEVRPPWLHLPTALVRGGAWGAEWAGRLLHIEPPLSLEGVRFFTESRAFSIEKARHELGWEPQVDIAEGTRRSVNWYRQEGLLGGGR